MQRWWHRDARVVPPPVAVHRYTPDPAVERDDFFLLAGRLVPYKRPEVAVAAARRAGVRLVVAGAGRSRRAVDAATGPGVELLGRVGDDELLDLYRRCAALVFPGEEDFGIVPVEAQACGTPVIAFGRGGATETVVPWPNANATGLWFEEQTVDCLASVMEQFETQRDAFDPDCLRAHALRAAAVARGS